MVEFIEPAIHVDTSIILIDQRRKTVIAHQDAELDRRITKVLRDPKGFPNGRGKKRTKLTPPQEQKLRSALVDAAGSAAAHASTFPNRMQGRGRRPDNAVLIFIDDIFRACQKAGLKPGLRYADPVSLPVLIYIELAPLFWPGNPKNPRRVFERWQKLRSTFVRA